MKGALRLVVTGRTGQLARALSERGLATGVQILCLARPQLDLESPGAVAPLIARARPDVVINAAAYVGVDAAEAAPELAMRINGEGARSVAGAAAQLRIPIIQISTDYVFNGALGQPYREADATAPLNAYGASKLAGERAALAANPRCVIARTSWLFSPFGGNFVSTMLHLGQTRPSVRVVADQVGAPTYALDLADALIIMAQRLRAEPDNAALSGVFHVAGSAQATWAEFARAIFALAAARGRSPVEVVDITSKDYGAAAERPADSRLDSTKLANVYGLRLAEWRVALPPCIDRWLDAQSTGRRRE